MQFVSGLAENAIFVTFNSQFQYIYIAMGLDSTTVQLSPNLHHGATSFGVASSTSFTLVAQIGFHFLQVIESGITGSSTSIAMTAEGIVFC